MNYINCSPASLFIPVSFKACSRRCFGKSLCTCSGCCHLIHWCQTKPANSESICWFPFSLATDIYRMS